MLYERLTLDEPLDEAAAPLDEIGVAYSVERVSSETVADGVVIEGGDARGLLYAVWEFCERELGVRFIRFWFTDILGFLKSFAITPAELESAFANGMRFDGSAINGFSRDQESDMLAQPDPATFQILPFDSGEGSVARMFCDIVTPDGVMNTFVTHPEEDGPFPVVLMLMDAPGRREELSDMARRLGAGGYYVMLPNLYYRRVRDFTATPERRSEMIAHMNSLTNAMVCEDARALLALEPGALLEAADADGLPMAWFELPAVRAATGWNQWEGTTYIAAEAWDQFVDALAEREMLLDLPGASDHAAELRRRAAEAGYRLGDPGATAER